MKRLSIMLTLCSLVFIHPAVFAQDATTGSVQGTVRDNANPLEGVRVVAASTDGIEHGTLTDSNGAFKIAGLAPGDYVMSFAKEGYAKRIEKRITISAAGVQYISRMMAKKGEMSIVMEGPVLKTRIMSKTGIVRGTVRDASPSKNPLEGVRVVAIVTDGVEHETQTDSNGEFEITGLPNGRHLMNFTKKGYEVRLVKPLTVSADGEQNAAQMMSKMGTLRGSVIDTSSLQNPIEDVRVFAVNPTGIEYETHTDSNGEFEMTGLPSGRYLVDFTKAGYGERLGKPITVTAGGDQYVAMKMSKKATFGSILKRLFGGDGNVPSKTTEEEKAASQNQKSGALIWLLLIGLVIVVGVVIIGRRSSRHSA